MAAAEAAIEHKHVPDAAALGSDETLAIPPVAPIPELARRGRRDPGPGHSRPGDSRAGAPRWRDTADARPWPRERGFGARRVVARQPGDPRAWRIAGAPAARGARAG